MARIRIPDSNLEISENGAVAGYLGGIGIDFDRWESRDTLPATATAAEVLGAWAAPIEALKKRGGYTTADVIDVRPETAGLEEMLNRFAREHWHDEDEVRFVIEGHGIFFIHPSDKPVVSIEVEPGDLIRVPAGVHHWFTLCADRRIRAIRLFQSQSGWAPRYTGSGADGKYEPICFGPAYQSPFSLAGLSVSE